MSTERTTVRRSTAVDSWDRMSNLSREALHVQRVVESDELVTVAVAGSTGGYAITAPSA